jgi:hypothetical protein
MKTKTSKKDTKKRKAALKTQSLEQRKAPLTLAQACASGKHIPEAKLTV